MPTKGQEKFKVEAGVFDAFTNRTIFKLISQDHFIGLESPLLIGKESEVFSAKTESGSVAVKIYRLENCDFRKMYDYIKDDPRYIDLKGKMRKIILAWVQREYRNLLKAREAGVRVPTPITFLNNVLVMEQIGDPAPQLKNQPPTDPEAFLSEIVSYMKKLHSAGLVHGDLSAFNILNLHDQPVFIDFSQCSPLSSPNADLYLDRDIKNVLTYFKKLDIEKDPSEIKKEITNTNL